MILSYGPQVGTGGTADPDSQSNGRWTQQGPYPFHLYIAKNFFYLNSGLKKGRERRPWLLPHFVGLAYHGIRISLPSQILQETRMDFVQRWQCLSRRSRNSRFRNPKKSSMQPRFITHQTLLSPYSFCDFVNLGFLSFFFLCLN